MITSEIKRRIVGKGCGVVFDLALLLVDKTLNPVSKIRINYSTIVYDLVKLNFRVQRLRVVVYRI